MPLPTSADDRVISRETYQAVKHFWLSWVAAVANKAVRDLSQWSTKLSIRPWLVVKRPSAAAVDLLGPRFHNLVQGIFIRETVISDRLLLTIIYTVASACLEVFSVHAWPCETLGTEACHLFNSHLYSKQGSIIAMLNGTHRTRMYRIYIRIAVYYYLEKVLKYSERSR